MKRNIVLILLLWSVMVFADKIIPIAETIQRKDQWCWSGCSTPILNYYGESVSQGLIVEYAYGDSAINQWNWLVGHAAVEYQGKTYYPHGIDEIMANWNTDTKAYYRALTEAEWRSEVDAGHPFVIRWGWNSGGGHFVVGQGYLDNGNYQIMDPWFGCGVTIQSYNWVKSAKGGQGNWTHSLTTDREVPVEKYDVLVAAGSGTGKYTEGETVQIVADQAPSGYIFDKWNGNTNKVTGTFDSVATFTMVAENLTFTALYKQEEVIDSSALSKNFLFIAGWDALADSYGSKATLDTTKVATDTTMLCTLKTVTDNAADEEWAWSQITVSSDTTYDKVDMVKIRYKAQKELRLILDQEELSLKGAAYEVILPATENDTTLYLPLNRFAQPKDVADSLEKPLLMEQVSGLSLALKDRDETVAFAIRELQLNGYVEKTVSLLGIGDKVSAQQLVLQGDRIRLHGFTGPVRISLYALNGKLLMQQESVTSVTEVRLPDLSDQMVLLKVTGLHGVFKQKLKL